MHLDVRLPIGLMFVIIGSILAIFGWVSSRAIYERSLGININLVWGAVMLVFGLIMLGFAWRASRRQDDVVADKAARENRPH